GARQERMYRDAVAYDRRAALAPNAKANAKWRGSAARSAGRNGGPTLKSARPRCPRNHPPPDPRRLPGGETGGGGGPCAHSDPNTKGSSGAQGRGPTKKRQTSKTNTPR